MAYKDVGLQRELGAEAAALLTAYQTFNQGFLPTANRHDYMFGLTECAGRAYHRLSYGLLIGLNFLRFETCDANKGRIKTLINRTKRTNKMKGQACIMYIEYIADKMVKDPSNPTYKKANNLLSEN